MQEEKGGNLISEESEPAAAPPGPRRRRFSARHAAIVAGSLSIVLIVLGIVTVLLYRNGAFDTYIKSQFVSDLADMNIVFDADVFRVTVDPLQLELRNATFTDKVTGQKLFFIRNADLQFSVTDLYAWHLSREISLVKTDVNGAEVWITFDAAGRSNFDNLNLIENGPEGRVSFKYESSQFAVQNSVVHFGDVSRDISGTGQDIVFSLAPQNASVPDDQKRYNFDLATKGSTFRYGSGTVDKIDLHATGVADHQGADVSDANLTTPVGDLSLSGNIQNWADPAYHFDLRSSIDLTQASSIFAGGTPLVGVGNFKGTLTGRGETYTIQGEADAQSLRAAGVSLKGVNIAATASLTNGDYEANGTAIAEMLTFDDFRVDFLKLVGNVRGSGTDFRWLGDLQAAAAKTKDLSLGGLFLKDAVGEYDDRELRLNAADGQLQRLQLGDIAIANLHGRGIETSVRGDTFQLRAPSAQLSTLASKDYRLNDVSGSHLTITNNGGETALAADKLRAASADLGGAKGTRITADSFKLKDHPTTTEFTAGNIRADTLDLGGAVASGVEAPSLTLNDSPQATLIYADSVRVAGIDAGAAIIGSLNVGGVRLSIVQGRVEARSNDIDAGRVQLAKSESLPNGGTLDDVHLSKPVYVLEPSDRYRATADMSIGGGALGSISLGAARATVEAASDHIGLNDISANVMGGQVAGNADIALLAGKTSTVNTSFTDLDLSKLIALQGGSVVPLEGKLTGKVALSFPETNIRSMSGSVNATVAANAGSSDRGFVPVNGAVQLTASNGLFNVDTADLRTDKTVLTANGRFDLRDNNSNLAVTLNSSDASEVTRLVHVLDVSPELDRQITDLQASLGGNLAFKGQVTGNITDPMINGSASVDSLMLKDQVLGSVSTDVLVSPTEFALSNGLLKDQTGGTATFQVRVPFAGVNNASVNATLTNVNAAALLAALPIDLSALHLNDLTGQTSGTVDIQGLPENAVGHVDLTSAKGSIAGTPFDTLAVKAQFSGSRIDLTEARVNLGSGRLSATGGYDRHSDAFDLSATGAAIPVSLVEAFIPNSVELPAVAGNVNFTASAKGVYSTPSTYDVAFDGTASDVAVDQAPVGTVTFQGKTAGQVLTASVTAALNGHPQLINAHLNFGDPKMPFAVSTEFDQSPLEPFLAFVKEVRDMPITGTGTGRIDFGGELVRTDTNGKQSFTADNLSGTAQFSQLSLQIQDTPLSALEPIVVRFTPREITFDKARFGGGGSNMAISGTKALTDAGTNDLSIDGRVNLNLLNLVSKDTFFTGLADTSIRVVGPNATARLNGTANVVNASVATFLGSGRLTIDRLKANLIFTANELEIEHASGYLGGGKFTASGGGTIDGLSVAAFRLAIDGNNVTVPLPEDFTTTGDAQLEITGQRRTPNSNLRLAISGSVNARRSLYTKDIELANIVGGRGEGILSAAGTGIGSADSPRLDLTIEGRDALVVKNNIADLTASVSLALNGSADNPQVSGRITATSGTILFRKDRYEIQRGVLEFPPNTTIDPIINLQAEAEIAGYQVFVDLNGPLKDSESLTANVRSNPALPQADVVSLVTTGNLANASGGIPTLAQSGINTAAEILTDAIINQPVRKATDKLFGLNVFEIDPIISGQQLNPTARLTVGRQINNNLRVTYATNLSQDQQQVLAFEYRVSNKLSLVAQYEQRSLTNVTRNRDNFSFEVRFRRRF